MIRFHASAFAAATSSIGRAMSILAAGASDYGAEELNDGEMRGWLIDAVNEAEKGIRDLPLSRVLTAQLERLKRRLTDDGVWIHEIQILLRELHENLLVELTSAWFLMIPAERRTYFEQRSGPLFGGEVEVRFPETVPEIAAAGRCFALDEWTACVFHLMRVLELGLREIATRLEVPMTATVEFENWRNVIDRIEKRIREIEQEPRSADKSERQQHYSEIAAQFRYFKDAWRNHVAHARSRYDEREALEVWNHVDGFMRHLAAVS